MNANEIRDAGYWIKKLCLKKHPEGGFFRETYRSPESMPGTALPERFSGDRAFSTSIYFLLREKDISVFHRLKQDEVWHFYEGTPVILHVIDSLGLYSGIKLGRYPEEGESFQAVIKAGCFFAAEISDKASFSLVGCTVAPGFDFEDIEIPAREKLIEDFPAHKDIIEKFTVPADI